jgi:hypothetical protein
VDTTDQLFIRACKSKNSDARIRSVYRRFYYSGKENNDVHIAGILSRLCEQYLDYTVGDLINDLHPGNGWKYGIEEDADHWTRCVAVLASKIALSKVSKFPGLTSPLMFRQAA